MTIRPLILSFVSLAGCSAELPLDDRPCPCAPGQACIVAENTCTAYEREAPGSGMPRCQRDVAECEVPEEYIVQSFKSGDDVARHLVGRWLWCGTTKRPEFAGIEFAADGRFYLLQPDTCERAFGFDRAGSWSTEDISEQNTPGTYQVIMRWDGAGTGGIVPAFSGRPRKMRDRGPGVLGTLVADPQ